MLKKLLLFSLIISFYSCAVKKINYTYDFKTIQQGVDFTQSKGLWLLNTLDIPERETGRQVNKILKKFNNWTNNNTIHTTKMVDKSGKKINLLLSKDISKDNLKLLQEVSNYKYIANIYILNVDDSNPKYTITEMMFDFYDITTKELFLSERVIGSMNHENTSNIGDIHGFRFNVTPDMVSGLIKKGLKKIDKNSKR